MNVTALFLAIASLAAMIAGAYVYGLWIKFCAYRFGEIAGALLAMSPVCLFMGVVLYAGFAGII